MLPLALVLDEEPSVEPGGEIAEVAQDEEDFTCVECNQEPKVISDPGRPSRGDIERHNVSGHIPFRPLPSEDLSKTLSSLLRWSPISV